MSTSTPRPPGRRRVGVVAVSALAIGGLTLTAAGAAPSTGADELTPAQEQALGAGLQVAPKANAAARSAAPSANPYIAFVPDATKADYAYWDQQMTGQAQQRLASPTNRASRAEALAGSPRSPLVHDEEEPAGRGGSNDTVANAEPIGGFGTAGGGNNRVRVLGEAADLAPATEALEPSEEDDGSITLARDLEITEEVRFATTGVLGDGPHGSAGTGSNDFDFYTVEVPAGASLVADTSGSAVDTVLAVYDAEGELLATDDDGGSTQYTSSLTYTPDEPGTYHVAVLGFSFFSPLPEDPFDSGSGAGLADEGDYTLEIGAHAIDSDFYSVKLRNGDVLGGTATGSADGLTVHRPDGTEMIGSVAADASALYPTESPLPGGGSTTFAYVAEQTGWYQVEIGADSGAYDVTLEAYRPGAQTDGRAGQVQTILLDFTPGRVNTGIWGGRGVTNLTPFSSFVPLWGVPRAQTDELIDRITAEVEENLEHEVAELGINPNLELNVTTTRDHPELLGQENVSRVIIGGTIEESGIETIGIAQFIDPGNYAHEDSAIVLLDVLSEVDGPASLNTYLEDESDRVAFVSQAVGSVTAHEVGHLIGGYHTDNLSETVNIMDAGGANFQNLFGVGPDGVGGTEDDADVHFTEDTYAPVEGFTGLENTAAVAAWAAFLR